MQYAESFLTNKHIRLQTMFDDRNIDVNRNRKHFCDFVSRNYLRHYSLLWRTCSRAGFNYQPARAAGNNPENLEIIVSDDRSPIPFPDTEGVSIVRRERNGGFGSAVNSGAARARGDWLIILNSDLELGENFISSMLTALAVYPQALASPK